MTLLLTLDDGALQDRLNGAVDLAREAAEQEAGAGQVGEHAGVDREDAVSASHRFAAMVPGYRGWHWSVTVACPEADSPVTVSEVVLVPGPDALCAPAWVPWERRVRAGDLGVGDIFPTDKDDPRLAPAYLASDDPMVEQVAVEAGLGRVHVLSRFGRQDAAERWYDSEFGPRSDMARSAPGTCGSCGFYLPLAGSLQAAFGVCGNEIAPADGRAVHAEYGCGAHSETEVEQTSSVPVAELVYDDSLLDTERLPEQAPEKSAPEAAVSEATVSVAADGPAAEAPAVETPVTEAGTDEAPAAGAPPAEAAGAEIQAVADTASPATPDSEMASAAATPDVETPDAEAVEAEAPAVEEAASSDSSEAGIPSAETQDAEAAGTDVVVDEAPDATADTATTETPALDITGTPAAETPVDPEPATGADEPRGTSDSQGE